LDNIAAVRAAAVRAVALAIPRRGECFFPEFVKARVCDEKVIVRKAALRCLAAVVEAASELPEDVVDLIADRARDVSVSLRQEAAELLRVCLDKWDDPAVTRRWLDAILPLALDADTKTQDLAVKLFSDCVLDAARQDVLARISQILPPDFHILPRLFDLVKRKGYRLKNLCRVLEGAASVECPPIIWELIHFLMELVPDAFHGDYISFWEDRDRLPDSYFAILVQQKVSDNRVFEHFLGLFRSIASGRVTDCSFGQVHWGVQYLAFCEAHAALKELLEQANGMINDSFRTEDVIPPQLQDFVAPAYLIGELFEFVPNLGDVGFQGLQLLMTPQLPNNMVVPPIVRAVTSVANGKLCRYRRDVTSSFVSVFAHQLHDSKCPSVKCNCLVALCDLSIQYSALVDPYVLDVTGCFADPSPFVRRQALLIATRLVVEDFVKLRPIIFFRFVFAIVDLDEEVAEFARNCLLDSIVRKDYRVLPQFFLDCLRYFNNQLDMDAIVEDVNMHQQFEMPDRRRREAAYQLLIGRLLNPIEVMHAIVLDILQEFIDDETSIRNGDSLLLDALFITTRLEEAMEEKTSVEIVSEDPEQASAVERSRMIISLVHERMVVGMLPILGRLHGQLRDANAPGQEELGRLFRLMCARFPSAIGAVRSGDARLAAEIEHDLQGVVLSEQQIASVPSSPSLQPRFRSRLLSRIAETTRPPIMGGGDDYVIGKQPPRPPGSRSGDDDSV
jgi:condensin-2 complex subunit D3